ncbi:GNAT superfamily N-acetyltransferase [Bacillus mesophilus]|uniref:GNAT family N-acetyltransferase n=1 Tax=Bacillus mesophilus TaxID=1808955 RepID=A0A6M0Q9L4_9BACI|nr:GNAT family N-acetyltransferase [Bacillus mesophilus]MBM7662328.1 GNAT superfamily N-acetyltransferase [Bacillus mesophilus]NEY73042.1 GNAT family N-acetyltransferase [Bacillus mesophilus]
MSEVKILDAHEEMLALIREQRVNAYSEYANVLPSEHWKALKRALSSGADSHEGVDIIAAELNGTIVGSVVLFPPKSNAYNGLLEELEYPEIRMLAVDPDARGKGIANALITECIERTKAKGLSKIGLHTGDFMKNAIHVYEKFGFKRLPQYDFEPANDGIIVRAYVLEIH